LIVEGVHLHVHLHVLTYTRTVHVHVQWINNPTARVRQMSVDDIPKRFSPVKQYNDLKSYADRNAPSFHESDFLVYKAKILFTPENKINQYHPQM